MAWTAPMTAVANATFTAAQWNTHVRDNLNMTAPGIATTNARYFVSTAANVIAERRIRSSINNTAGTTSSGTYANIPGNFGPSVTVETGANAIVWWCAELYNSTDDAYAAASVAVDGATTIAAADTWALEIDGYGSGAVTSQQNRFSIAHMFTTLTPGNNTFTMQYRGSATATVDQRVIVVMPL